MKTTEARKIECALVKLCLCMLFFMPVVSSAQQVLIIDVNVFGLNENQSGAANQIATACNTLDATADTSAAALDLQSTCQIVEGLDPNNPDDVEQLQAILDSVAPEEAFTMNDSLVYVSDYQTTNVYARINTLRKTPADSDDSNDSPADDDDQAFISDGLFKTGLSLSLNDTDDELEDSLSSSGGLFSKMGLFFSGNLSQGDIDGDRNEQNTDFSTTSFTVGTDYRFTDRFVAGVGVGAIQQASEFTQVAGGTDSDGFNVTLFGTWYKQDAVYIDAVVDFGSNSFDLERDIATQAGTPVFALADTESSSTSVTLGAGGNANLGAWDVGGYFRLSLTDASVDGYDERASNAGPGSGSVYSIGSQSISSQKLVFGVETSRVINTSRAVFVPSLRLELETENEESKENISATLLTSQTTGVYRGTERDTSYVNLGVGASAVMPGGKNAFVYYETHLQHDFVTQNWLKAGLRFEF